MGDPSVSSIADPPQTRDRPQAHSTPLAGSSERGAAHTLHARWHLPHWVRFDVSRNCVDGTKWDVPGLFGTFPGTLNGFVSAFSKSAVPPNDVGSPHSLGSFPRFPHRLGRRASETFRDIAGHFRTPSWVRFSFVRRVQKGVKLSDPRHLGEKPQWVRFDFSRSLAPVAAESLTERGGRVRSFSRGMKCRGFPKARRGRTPHCMPLLNQDHLIDTAALRWSWTPMEESRQGPPTSKRMSGTLYPTSLGRLSGEI